jgi:acetoin utilization protein AcuC
MAESGSGTCVYLGEALARYGFGENHPFGNDRLHVFRREFERRGLHRRTRLLEPVRGSRELLALFHHDDYLDFLEESSRRGKGFLDGGDTPVFRGIWEASLTVAGTVCDAARRLLEKECSHAFVPIAGLHHARPDGAAGFCAINDCGIVIEYLKQEQGLERIAYVDIDAHHGDGVYYAFESDPSVILVDFHEDGRYLYPGTGDVAETGRGIAAGTKLNVPLPPEADDALFWRLWPRAEAFLRRFKPGFCILQAGADSIAGDPITHLEFSPGLHAGVTAALAGVGGMPLLVLGGGGYNRGNLAEAWNGVVEALLEKA